MTQSTDPWAAAETTYRAPAPAAAPAEPGSALDGAYDDSPAESALLFGGSGQGLAPSLFNKTHFVGSERTGIITKAPYDQQDVDFNSKQPKYWSLSREVVEGTPRATTINAVDGPTGKPNRPVMATHINLDTAYRQDLAEWLALERKAEDFDPSRDDGKRDFVLGTKLALDAMRKGIQQANAAGISIRKGEDMVGLRLTAKRTGKQANQSGKASWTWEITLSRP